MTEYFSSIFKRAASPAARAKFLSRVFGIFSEEIVSIWSQDARAPYAGLGRPTIRFPDDLRGHTLDFTFRERKTDLVFVAEMKCEIEYQNFQYFVLDQAEQLAHHKKPAFEALLKAASRKPGLVATVGKRPVQIDGAMLVWGCMTASGRSAVMSSYGFHDVLGVSDICADLAAWKNEAYRILLAEREQWCTELFSDLLRSDAAGA